MLSCDAAGSRHALRTRQLCCARRWLKAVSRSPTRPIAPPRWSTSVALAAPAARFPDVRSMLEADLRGWLPVMDVVLPEDQIATIVAEAEHVLERFVTTSG